MDAPSSFLFGLERKHRERKLVHSLLSATGQELTEPRQIRKRAVEFYSSLYRVSMMRVKSCWRSSAENYLRSLRRPISSCNGRWVCENLLQPSRACRATRLLVSMV